MVHLILTGATGLVGNGVLRHIQSLPANSPITKLTILSRSPIPAASTPSTTNTTKIEVINHTDYLNYPPDLTNKLSDASAIIWAQGISQTQASSPAEYSTITKAFPLAAASAFALSTNPELRANTPLRFIYVSGEGATQNPGMFTQLFGRVKGEAERALMDLPSQPGYAGKLAVYCPRPGGVYSPNKAEYDAFLAKNTLGMRVLVRATLPVLKVVYQGALITTPDLGKVLVDLALREEGEPFEKGSGVGEEGRVLQNVAIRRLAGL